MARERLEGAAKLDRALLRLGRSGARRVLGRSLRAGAKVIQEEARRQVRPHEVEGDVYRSIRVRGKKSRRGEVGVRVVTLEGPPDIEPGEFAHAHFLERGTEHSKAYPFMEPAFDNRSDEAVRVIMRQTAIGIMVEAVR